MSLNVKLQSETLKSYTRTEDAHQAFKTAVGNGQARLAMDVLSELLDGLVAKIEELESKLEATQDIVEEPAAKLAPSRKVTKGPQAPKDEEEDKVPADE